MNERLWGWGPAICFNKVSRWSWRAVRFENHCSALLGHGCCCCLVAKSCYDSFATPWAIVCQAPLSMGFPSQEHWSGLPFLSPGNLPNPPIEPTSPALAGGFFTTEPPGKPALGIVSEVKSRLPYQVDHMAHWEVNLLTYLFFLPSVWSLTQDIRLIN